MRNIWVPAIFEKNISWHTKEFRLLQDHHLLNSWVTIDTSTGMNFWTSKFYCWNCKKKYICVDRRDQGELPIFLNNVSNWVSSLPLYWIIFKQELYENMMILYAKGGDISRADRWWIRELQIDRHQFLHDSWKNQLVCTNWTTAHLIVYHDARSLLILSLEYTL